MALSQSGMIKAMTSLAPALIHSWHAHLYFDADGRDAAWALREAAQAELAAWVQVGRFHEHPVGPHPIGSSQLAFAAEHLAPVLGWLVLNHGDVDVFIHPNTGDDLRDHRVGALWLGRCHRLNLAALGA